jgi:hypothetical protein
MGARQQDFISQVRTEASAILDAVSRLHALRAEWDALAYGANLTTDDFVGENADLDVAEITGVFTTVEAIDALLSAGHATNLYKVYR